MKRTLTLCKALIINWVRSKSGMFFSFLFPLLLLLVFGSVFGGSQQVRYSLHVLNRDLDSSGNPTNLSEALIEALNSTKSFNLVLAPSNVEPLEYIRNNTNPFSSNVRLLIISEGFQERVIRGSFKGQIGVMITFMEYSLKSLSGNISSKNKTQIRKGLEEMKNVNQSLPDVKGELTLLVDPSDPNNNIIKGIIYSVVNAFSFKLIGGKEVVTLKTGNYTVKTYTPVDYYLPGYIAAFIMTNGVMGVTSLTTDFKRRGILKRLITTPLTKMEWILANIFSQTILAILLTLVMVFFAWAVFKVTALPGFYSWILIFIGSILFSGLGMVLGGLIKDVEAASAIGNAIAFPMMFLSGSFWPLEIMPTYMQLIAKVLPLTYFSEGLRFTLILGYPQGALLDFVVMGCLAAIFIFLASAVTCWREK